MYVQCCLAKANWESEGQFLLASTYHYLLLHLYKKINFPDENMADTLNGCIMAGDTPTIEGIFGYTLS